MNGNEFYIEVVNGNFENKIAIHKSSIDLVNDNRK